MRESKRASYTTTTSRRYCTISVNCQINCLFLIRSHGECDHHLFGWNLVRIETIFCILKHIFAKYSKYTGKPTVPFFVWKVNFFEILILIFYWSEPNLRGILIGRLIKLNTKKLSNLIIILNSSGYSNLVTTVGMLVINVLNTLLPWRMVALCCLLAPTISVIALYFVSNSIALFFVRIKFKNYPLAQSFSCFYKKSISADNTLKLANSK